MKVKAISLICVAILASNLLAQQVEDTIKWKDPNRPQQSCTVKEETYAQIKFLIKGSTAMQDFNMDAVQEVIFGRKPPRLEGAENDEKIGKYDSAINWYKKLAEEVKNNQQPKNFLQYALYGQAKALQAMKNYNNAIDTYNKLKTQVPDTKFLRDAYLNLYECYTKKGDQQNAEKTIDEMDDFRIQHSLNSWEDDVTILKAKSLEAKGDYNGARQKYTIIQGSKNVSDSTKESATLGEIRCLSGLKDYVKLARRSKELLDSSSSPAILAYAYTYLGETTLQDKDCKSAMDLFLHTVLLYPDCDYQIKAKAYYGAIISMARLASQSSQQEKDKYKERADSLCNELASYNQSLASKAREELNKIK